ASCLGGYCCGSGVDVSCATCNSTGLCDSCSSGKYLDGTTCKSTLSGGSQCSSSDQCTSGACIGGYCCSSGTNTGCTACNNTGYCATCSSSYYLSNSVCVSKKSSGD